MRSSVLRRISILSTTALVALAASGTNVLAQDDGFFMLEEIVVTAQKREQSLQDVPVAVTALTGNMLAEQGIVDIFDIAVQVPSLIVTQNTSPLNTAYKLRGIGNNPNIPNFEPAVGLFIDGVFMSRSGLGIGDLVDIERVEILKGPQSTLYGKNVTGGVIHIITKKPGQEFEGQIEASLSQIDGANNAFVQRYVGALSGPITDTIGASLSAVYYDQQGTDINLTTGNNINEVERYAFRGQIYADIGDTSSLRLIGSHSKMPDTTTGNPDFFQGTTPAALNGMFGVPCADIDPTDRRYCLNEAGRASMESNGLSATFETEIGENALTSITAYNDYSMVRSLSDADQTNVLLARMKDTQKGASFSQEIRLASPSSDTFDWLVGGYYYKSTFERGDRGETPFFVMQDFIGFLPLAPGYSMGTPGDLGFLDSRTKSEYYALFGQGTYRFSDKFAFTGGLRYGHEDKKTSIANSSITTDTVDETPFIGINLPPINLITAVLSPEAANAELSLSKGRWTWNTALQYYPSDDAMLYFNYARGAKSGSFNSGFGNTAAANREFGAEIVDHFELGAKLELLDRRLVVNAAAFYSDFQNFQNAGFVSLQFLVNNAEKVTSTGFEIEGQYLITENLRANFGITHQDTKYEEYTGGSCYPGQAPTNAAGTACDLAGIQLAQVPKWKSVVGLQYNKDVSFGEVFGRVDWAWSDSYASNTNFDPRHVQESYSLVNARVGVSIDRFEVSLWADNLFNKTYVTGTGVSNLFGTDPAYQTFLGRPREIGLTAKVRF